MKKSDWQYLVDTLLFICIMGIASLGFLLGFFLPKGPKAPESAKYFLGLHRHQWGNIHFYLSLAFVILVIVHLILSWSWIKSKARNLFKRGWGTALISTAIVSVLVLFFFWIFYPRTPGAYEDYGVRAGRQAREKALEEPSTPDEGISFAGEGQDYIVITGQMSLREVENLTGISARKIAEALGLSSKVDLDESLGTLRKRYPFTMQEARDIIADLLNQKAIVRDEKKIEKVGKERVDKAKIEEPKKEHEDTLTSGRMAEDTSKILITGQMTLYDLERETGIPAQRIAQKLRLPPGAPLEERIGRLRKIYLFTMQELREVVSSLLKERGKRR